MATNLTKGKTTKTKATKRIVPNTGAETAAAVAAATKPTLSSMIGELTAAVGDRAIAAVNKQSIKPKPATPLHKFPTDSVAKFGGELLLRNVAFAHALGRCDLIREQVVMSHDQYGVISLRMVGYVHDNVVGFLIGLIDTKKATYTECEFYAIRADADQAWTEWLDAAAM